MKLKINRYEFDVTNKDIILDNGDIYQCMTLKHQHSPNAGGAYSYVREWIQTNMSKKQFKKLLKNNQVVLLSREQYPKLYQRYSESSLKLWRFNVEQEGGKALKS